MAKDFAKKFYDSKLWGDIREGVLQRDHYTCQRCGKPAQEVHHIIHLSEDNINDPNITINGKNLESLCHDCHSKEHVKDRVKGEKKSYYQCGQSELPEGFYFDEFGQLQKRKKLG